MENDIVLLSALFLVALLYSSVGHGGASGYLAILALFSIDPKLAGSSALLLNLLVAGTAWFSYARARHFSWKTLFPFVLGSIPAAFLGGLMHVSDTWLKALLAFALLWAALRMFLPDSRQEGETIKTTPNFLLCIVVGLMMGFVSGLIGIGGGIFLSPLMILLGWGTTKSIAGISASFIVLNSFAGLAGRYFQGSLVLGPVASWVLVAFVGGILGSWLGARRLTPVWLRRILGIVLGFAAFKLFRQISN